MAVIDQYAAKPDFFAGGCLGMYIGFELGLIGFVFFNMFSAEPS